MDRKIRTAKRNFEGAVKAYQRSRGNRYLKSVLDRLAGEYGKLLELAGNMALEKRWAI